MPPLVARDTVDADRHIITAQSRTPTALDSNSIYSTRGLKAHGRNVMNSKSKSSKKEKKTSLFTYTQQQQKTRFAVCIESRAISVINIGDCIKTDFTKQRSSKLNGRVRAALSVSRKARSKVRDAVESGHGIFSIFKNHRITMSMTAPECRKLNKQRDCHSSGGGVEGKSGEGSNTNVC